MPPAPQFSRRRALGLGASTLATATLASTDIRSSESPAPAWQIIDTNVSLFQWPSRRLPLDDTQALIAKLRALGVTQAWAGSFEGLLHRDIAQVNRRLIEACGAAAELVPVGSINPTLPAWEDDLRHCLEAHRLRVIRLHPGYHGYTLDDPRLLKLLHHTAAAKCLVQIAVSMEDVRTQNLLLQVADVNLDPLPALQSQVSAARIQLLNYRPTLATLSKLMGIQQLYFDTARVEGTAGVPQLVQNLPAGRVLYGSHAPLLIPQAALIRVHESGQLSDRSLQAVLAGNAERLMAGIQP